MDEISPKQRHYISKSAAAHKLAYLTVPTTVIHWCAYQSLAKPSRSMKANLRQSACNASHSLSMCWCVCVCSCAEPFSRLVRHRANELIGLIFLSYNGNTLLTRSRATRLFSAFGLLLAVTINLTFLFNRGQQATAVITSR